MKGGDFASVTRQPERPSSTPVATKVIVHFNELEIVGHLTADSQFGSEELKKLSKGPRLNIGTNALHEDQGPGPSEVPQPLLQFWPAAVVQVDSKMPHIRSVAPSLHDPLPFINKLRLIAF
jgi:hypothetical protein